MSLRTAFAAGIAAMLVLIAGCAPRPPAPAPTPPPAPAPAPPPPPVLGWEDAALSPGDWGYDSRLRPRAAFGAEGPVFVIECTDARQITLSRIGVVPSGSTLGIRTTFGARSLGASGQPSATTATLAASDPLLDEIVFSRGRFMVHVDGLPDLILPSWPEPAHVIEDCRG